MEEVVLILLCVVWVRERDGQKENEVCIFEKESSGGADGKTEKVDEEREIKEAVLSLWGEWLVCVVGRMACLG